MTDQQISNEGAFVRALGLNPDTIVAGSVEVKFANGQPFIQFTQVIGVDNATLGSAFLASTQPPPQPEEITGQQEETGAEGPRQPQDHRPKKTAQRTASRKKEEAGESAD